MQQTPQAPDFVGMPMRTGEIPNSPTPAEPYTLSTQPEGPVGIGGWLLLPILGLFGSIGWTVYNLITGYAEIAFFLMNLGDYASNEVAFPAFLSLGSAVLLICLASFALFQIFTHSPKAPRTMIIYFIMVIILTTIDGWSLNQIEAFSNEPQTSYAKDLGKAIVRAIIWIPYFHLSKRVANTFKSKEKNIAQQIEKVFS